MNTIREGTEHPGISSNQTQAIRSLHNPSHYTLSFQNDQMLTGTDVRGSCAMPPT
jgi:hypothetical protein